MIKILPLGGCNEIGASAIYLNIDGTGILLDCGIHPKRKGTDSLPKFELIENLPLDYVFISHAHQDHIGALPLLIKKYPHVLVYTTTQTQEIANLTLHNAVSILEKEFNDDSLILYTHEEIDLLVRSIIAVDYYDEIEIKGHRHKSLEPIYINLFDAGHILGSASILIKYKHQQIWYTGDIKLSPQQIMNKAKLPHHTIDTVITETTYGALPDKQIPNLEAEKRRFAKEINRIITKGGSVLVPVFALGKTQEVLAIIGDLLIKGDLTEVPIYTGGIGLKINRLYDKSRYVVNVRDKNFELSDVPQADIFEVKDPNHFKKKPGIILASSGMMIEGTQSYKLVKYCLRQKDFGVFFVGYVDEETPAFKVLNSKMGEKVKLSEFAEEIERKCEVMTFKFPSHSSRGELYNFIPKLKPSQIILVHGENDARDWFGYNILKEHPNIKVYAPDIGSEIIIE